MRLLRVLVWLRCYLDRLRCDRLLRYRTLRSGGLLQLLNDRFDRGVGVDGLVGCQLLLRLWLRCDRLL